MRPIALAAVLALAPAAADGDTVEAMADGASALLQALSESEREDASWPFEDGERVDVHYAPIGLDGARHGDLDDGARSLAEQLLAVTLSGRGHEQARAIRDLERDVLRRESGRFFGFAWRWIRDPGRYFWAFFGDPATDRRWGFRYEGHHLSLNVTSVPGAPPATTPLFLGAQPRVVPEGWPSAGVAALGEEERLARALYASLAPEQRRLSTLPHVEGRGNMLGHVPRLDAPPPVGLARSAMDAGQRELLDALLERSASFWADEIAQTRRSEIEATSSTLHFAHVESDTPPNAFYTRIAGTGLLIEIDNTEDGDHVHFVWHRPGADFGDDLLARHLERDHGRTLVRR